MKDATTVFIMFGLYEITGAAFGWEYSPRTGLVMICIGLIIPVAFRAWGAIP